MIYQRQHWKDHDIIILIDKYSSVHIELNKSIACIYNLWVDEKFRKQGHAKFLLEKAELLIKGNKYRSSHLYWSPHSEKFVLDWYKRQGYKVVNTHFNGEKFLKKVLKQ
jgi:ribosomal protein S18 acetylase RimI-like enzyme